MERDVETGTDPGVAQASSVKSLAAAFELFRRFSSPKLIAVGLAVSVAIRATLGFIVGWSWWDVLAVAIVVGLVPVVEWFIHLFILHAKPRTVAGLVVDPGLGHREHHLNPASVNRVLLRGLEASMFQVINGLVVLLVVGGPLWLLNAPLVGPIVTGVAAAIAGLAHYEWSHFLFHTAYRPKTRYYARLKTNHRLHHWRNENYWLGVTTNLGDRLLRTYPATKSAVPLSPTAKTLGIDPDDHRRNQQDGPADS